MSYARKNYQKCPTINFHGLAICNIRFAFIFRTIDYASISRLSPRETRDIDVEQLTAGIRDALYDNNR